MKSSQEHKTKNETNFILNKKMMNATNLLDTNNPPIKKEILIPTKYKKPKKNI